MTKKGKPNPKRCDFRTKIRKIWNRHAERIGSSKRHANLDEHRNKQRIVEILNLLCLIFYFNLGKFSFNVIPFQ